MVCEAFATKHACVCLGGGGGGTIFAKLPLDYANPLRGGI